jgi:hypothetical protein
LSGSKRECTASREYGGSRAPDRSPQVVPNTRCFPSQHPMRDRSPVKNGLIAAKPRTTGIDGQLLGNGTTFSAVAPSRPARRPSIQIFGSSIPIMSPRARIHGCETFNVLIGSAAIATFCYADPHCSAVWPVYYIPPSKLPVCFAPSIRRQARDSVARNPRPMASLRDLTRSDRLVNG